MERSESMRTLEIRVEDLAEVKERWRELLEAAERGDAIETGDSYTFPSVERMGRMLSANRWKLLQAMMGGRRTGIRELARRLGRDVKGVHTDVQKLLNIGLLEKSEDGGIVFPYDRIQILVEAAAT